MTTRKSSAKYLIVALTEIIFLATVKAQSPESAERIKAIYPDELGVYLDRSKTISLIVQEDSLIAAGYVNEDILFLKEEAKHTKEFRIYGSHFVDIVDLKVRSQVKQNRSSSEIEQQDITRKQDDDGSTFYNDDYYYPVTFPNAAYGNRCMWSYKEKYLDPRFISSFYFVTGIPLIKSSFTIKASPGVELSWQVFNDENKMIQFRKYEKAGFTYYEWKGENMPGYVYENDSPPSNYYAPRVSCHVKSFRTRKGDTKYVLSELKDLYTWYRGFINMADDTPSQEMESLLKELKSPNDREIDVVKKVFYWVQNNIRYIAFEDGMRGLVPHKPGYVLEKRYGDCKDMANLIVGLLKVADVKSYCTFIGTRSKPFRYTLEPTPQVSNHMIATYITSDGRYYFLDATSNYTSLELPSSMIQGKEALIALEENKYAVIEVPEMDFTKNEKVDSLNISIEKNSLVGEGRAWLSGYQKIDASYDFDKVKEESIKGNIITWFKKGNNKFILNEYSLSGLHNQDAPLIVNYSFHIENYIREIGDEIYINMNMDKIHQNDYISTGRKIAREFDFKYENKVCYKLKIPEGYNVEYLPASSRHDGKYLGFEMSYTVSDNHIILTSSIYVNALMLTSDQFANWNASVKLLSDNYKESVIFKKKQ